MPTFFLRFTTNYRRYTGQRKHLAIELM